MKAVAFFVAVAALCCLAEANVSCGGGEAYCPDATSCCPTAAGGWSCCPFSGASCCADHVHCCPSNYPICQADGACESRVGSPMPRFLRAPAVHVMTPAQRVEGVAAAAVVAAASGNMTIHLLTNPTSPRGKQHCQQLTVPGGESSPFWADEGWRYTMPPWAEEGCPAYFNFVNAIEHNLDGFDGVTWVKFGVQTGDEVESAVEASTGNMTIHLLTNPTSPRGKQHCQQLTVPGGESSPFWADEGWRYTMPPWAEEGCPAYFNFVNAIEHNLDGFDGVTWVKFGVQTGDAALE